MAFGESALPKKLAVLLFLRIFLIYANPGESHELSGSDVHEGCPFVSIEMDPSSSCIIEGAAFTLSCSVTNEHFEGRMWYKDGRAMHAESLIRIDQSKTEDSGSYTCQTIYKVPPFTPKFHQKTISVDVQKTAGIKVTASRSSVRVKLHDSATLSCHVKGHSPSDFMWKHIGIKGARNLTNLGETLTINNTDSTMTLRLENVTLDMEGVYECRARICSREFRESINLTVSDISKASQVYAKAVGASRVGLNWTLDDGNDPAKLFVNRTGSSRYVETTISNNSLLELRNTSVVDNLNDSTTYKFEDVSTNSVGESFPAYSENTTTFDKDPDFIPKLEIAGVSLDSIDVQASLPPVEMWNCIGYYGIMITGNEKEDKLYNWTDIDSIFSIRSLTPETSYRLQVAACDACLEKCGNWSDEVEVSTAGKEFNYAANVSVKAAKNNTIKIGWNKPSPAEIYRILKYQVRATYESDNRTDWILDRTIVSYTFNDLNPNVTYKMELTVCIYGSGDCAENIQSAAVKADTTDCDPVFVPTVSINKTTSDSVTVVWTSPSEEERDRVAGYKVQATDALETIGLIGLPNNRNSHVFGGLEPQTMFQFQVAACGVYEDQCGNWSIAVNGTTIAKELVWETILWQSLIVVAVVIAIAMGIWTRLRKRREKANIWKFNLITLQRIHHEALDFLEPNLDAIAQAELLPYHAK